MSNPNPYHYTHAADDAPQIDSFSKGAWRDGDLLIMLRTAILPARCIFTGLPSTVYLPCKLEESPENAKISVPHSSEVLTRQSRGEVQALGITFMLYMLVVFLLIYLHMVYGLHLPFVVGGAVGLAFVFLFIGAAASDWARPTLTLVQMNDTHYWLRGAHPEFLAALPKWPHERT